jgi:hypothetical protein
MKMNSDWKSSTLEQLENDNWGEPNYGSYLVTRTHELRRVPLKNFTVEDLRIMIGQNFSLKYLLPLAIEELEKDLFAEGDFYPGDLLQHVLNINPNYWTTNKEHYSKINELILNREIELEANNISVDRFKETSNKK